MTLAPPMEVNNVVVGKKLSSDGQPQKILSKEHTNSILGLGSNRNPSAKRVRQQLREEAKAPAIKEERRNTPQLLLPPLLCLLLRPRLLLLLVIFCVCFFFLFSFFLFIIMLCAVCQPECVFCLESKWTEIAAATKLQQNILCIGSIGRLLHVQSTQEMKRRQRKKKQLYKQNKYSDKLLYVVPCRHVNDIRAYTHADGFSRPIYTIGSWKGIQIRDAIFVALINLERFITVCWSGDWQRYCIFA